MVIDLEETPSIWKNVNREALLEHYNQGKEGAWCVEFVKHLTNITGLDPEVKLSLLSDIAETMIRPYNTEKIDIIRNMNNLIYKVRLLN